MERRYQGGIANRAETRTQEQIDLGLRSYMLQVYNYMAIGLAVTGVVAFAIAQWVMSDPAVAQTLYGSPLRWVIFLAPLALVFFFSFRIHKMSAATAQGVFWTFAALMGLSLASIFLVYTGMSIAKVFFMTAGMFAAMSLYGYTTKRDLSNWGAFLFMGLIGVIIALVVNMFLQSPALHFAVSVIGVLIFVGLTAYDTQKIKEMYNAMDDREIHGKKAIMGALRLYLDFINMFMFLLALFGNRE